MITITDEELSLGIDFDDIIKKIINNKKKCVVLKTYDIDEISSCNVKIIKKKQICLLDDGNDIIGNDDYKVSFKKIDENIFEFEYLFEPRMKTYIWTFYGFVESNFKRIINKYGINYEFEN